MKEKGLKRLLNIITAIMLVAVISLPAIAYAVEIRYDVSGISYTKTVLRGDALNLSGTISCSVDMDYIRLTIFDYDGNIELQKTAKCIGQVYDLSKFNTKIDTQKLLQGNKMLQLTSFTASSSECIYTGALTAINPTAKPVEFSLEEGKQVYNSTLRLSSETEDAKIYYTTDGSIPTTSSNLYTAPLLLKDDITINVVAYKNGMSYSGMTKAKYTIEKLSPESIDLNSEYIALKPNTSYTLSTKVLPKGALHSPITYTSSNKNVAAVNESGTITAVGSGYARITASIEEGIYASCIVSCNPTHTHYHQGDTKWNIPYEVKKKLCLTTSYAMVLKNLGFPTNPEILYNDLNGESATQYGIESNYSVTHVPATSSKSKYYGGFINGRTLIHNPEKNAVKAATEALKKHPEGVIMYFKNGEKMHAAVAVGVNSKGELLFDDPGRTSYRGHNVTFKNSWFGVQGYSYKNLICIIALDV